MKKIIIQIEVEVTQEIDDEYLEKLNVSVDNICEGVLLYYSVRKSSIEIKDIEE
jgi:hypothetical protein